MRYPKYPLVSSDPLQYHFFSEGPKGTIKKAVVYARIEETLFNLAFGDWDEELERVDDSTRSNNNDRDKVLATVAFTALAFIARFPNVQIFAEGNTAARTRLYQMSISHNLKEISEFFKVEGFINGDWEQFREGRNYEAFLIQRK